MRTFSELRKYRCVVRELSILTLALTCFPSSIPAQQQAPYQLQVKTQLVALDVSVEDRDGHPVDTLTRSDFQVFENGVQQKIVGFEAPAMHAGTLRTPVRSTEDIKTAGSLPLTVLVLDEMNGVFEENAYARLQLESYLKHQPATLVQPATLLVETDSTFESLLDFTQDRDRLLAALERHKPGLPTHRMLGGSTGTVAIQRALFTLNAVQQVSQAYAGLRGRKNIVWVGNALPGVNTQSMPDNDAEAINTAVQRTLNVMLSTHTALYTIDPRANASATEDLGATLDEFGMSTTYADTGSTKDPFAMGQNFNMLAAASGGAAISGRNAIDLAIVDVLRRGNNFYTLFYRPTTVSNQPQAYRRISVKVNRQNLVLGSRQGYYANTPPAAQAQAETPLTADGRSLLSLDLSSAATDGLVYTGLPVTASLSADRQSVMVTIAANNLQWQPAANDNQFQAGFIALLVTFDAKGRLLTHHTYNVTAGPASETGTHDPVQLRFASGVVAKSARIRLVLREAATGKVGSAEIK